MKINITIREGNYDVEYDMHDRGMHNQKYNVSSNEINVDEDLSLSNHIGINMNKNGIYPSQEMIDVFEELESILNRVAELTECIV